MKLYGRIFKDGKFINGYVEFDKTITDVAQCDNVEEARYIIPGLIDIHTHGAVGEDASDGNPEGLKAMSRYYAAKGVTSWLATTMTIKEPELLKVVDAIKGFERPQGGAKIAGIHMEGPFINMEKRGAQAPENIHTPDVQMFDRINEASGNQVKLITVAPEEPGALEFIEYVSKKTAVSLGHTTAGYDISMAAYEKGASHATHLYNAMPALAHRGPGVIGAAFDSGATVELICDGLHIHPSVIRMTSQLYGRKLVLVSDSLRCAGMPDGEYMLSGHPITVKDGKATLKGTDTLAGASIHLMDAVRNCVKFGLSLEDAVYAATAAPAKVIGMDDKIGSIETGKCADMVVLDNELNVEAVYVDGIRI